MAPNHDEQIVCADCGETFLFTAAEAAFYEQKNLAAPPKRCKPCRAARKSARPDVGDRGGSAQRRPRYTGDVNEYRSPMQDTGFSPARGNAFSSRGDTFSPSRGDRGASAPRGREAPPRDGGYRAPAFRGGRSSAPNAPARSQHQPPAAPATRARSHGAMFDTVCVTCGVATQVPFRPIEGRDVFCQPCYRARKPVHPAG